MTTCKLLGPAALGATSLGVGTAVLLLPLTAFAQIVSDNQAFDCNSNAHTFISALISEKRIDPRSSRVEANSVNAFRPASGTQLSAFGFPIYAVFGYAPGDALFHRGTGRNVSSPLYGVVVRGPAQSVRTRVREANSNAAVHPVIPLLLTAVVCGG